MERIIYPRALRTTRYDLTNTLRSLHYYANAATIALGLSVFSLQLYL